MRAYNPRLGLLSGWSYNHHEHRGMLLPEIDAEETERRFNSFVDSIKNDTFDANEIFLTGLGLTDKQVDRLMAAINGNLKIAQRLTRLILSENALSAPPDVSKLEALQDLSLDQNCLTMPPDVSGCPALKSLYLQGSNLNAPPDVSKCPKLEYLNLNVNKLRILPDISDCPALKNLDILYNPLSSVSQLALIALRSKLPNVEINFTQNLSVLPKVLTREVIDEHNASIMGAFRKELTMFSINYAKIAYKAAIAVKGVIATLGGEARGANFIFANIIPYLIKYPSPEPAISRELALFEKIFTDAPNFPNTLRVLQEYADDLKPVNGVAKNPVIQNAEQFAVKNVVQMQELASAKYDADYDRRGMISLKNFLAANKQRLWDLSNSAEANALQAKARSAKREELGMRIGVVHRGFIALEAAQRLQPITTNYKP